MKINDVVGIPNLSPDFLNWIEENNFIHKTIVEIGSGHSTIFFTNHFNFVYSFEDNIHWFKKIKFIANEKNINNLKLSKFNVESIEKDDFIELIKLADVFLIDNNPKTIPRSKFVEIINTHKKDEAIIVLDNGNWNTDAYEILKEKYRYIDFPYQRYNGEKTETSVFFKK